MTTPFPMDNQEAAELIAVYYNIPVSAIADISVLRTTVEWFKDEPNAKRRSISIKRLEKGPDYVKRAAETLAKLMKPTYFDGVPMDLIHTALEEQGLMLLDEDGEEWQGLMCGLQGRSTIQIGKGPNQPLEKFVQIMWHRMPAPSTKTEVIAYIG